MKRLFATALLALSSIAFGATTVPVQLLSPTGSTSGQAIVSTGPGSAPGWSNVSLTAGVSGTLPVANGGTNATSAASARTNLGAAASGANTDITSLSSPAIGSATATTQTAGTNNTTVATTAFVNSATSAGGQPYFKATMSTNQTLTAGTPAKINFNTKAEDSNSAYDATTNFRFTPQKSGLYLVNVTLSMSSTVTAQGNYTYAAWIYKNGSAYSGWGSTGYAGAGANTSATPTVVTLVRLNGTTDYVEAWGEIFSGQTSPTVSSGTTASFFSAYYVGP